MKNYIRLLKYLMPYKKLIAVTWVLSILVIAMQGISVWVGAGFIENILTGEFVEKNIAPPSFLASAMNRMALEILQQSTPFKSLIAGVIVLIGTACLTAIFRILKSFLFSRLNQDILLKIRSEMFLHLTRLDLSFSRTFQSGTIASLFVNDVEQLKMAILDVVDRLFMQPLRLIAAVVLMLSLSVELTVFTILFLLASSLVVHLVGDKIENLTRRLMKKIADLQGLLTEYLSTVMLVRSMGREEQGFDSFSKASKSLAKTSIEFDVVRGAVPQMIQNLFVLSGGFILILGGYRVLVDHTMAGGDLVKLILLIPVATYPIKSLASLYLSIRITLASAKRVFGFLNEKISFEDHPDAIDPAPIKKSIQLKHVFYSIEDKIVLDTISISIPKGSTAVLYGPSGAGKSTILNLIAGFAKPDSGSILIDDIDLSRIKGEEWRRRIGIVTQEPVLINGTVRDNLLYGSPEAGDDELVNVLKEVLLWNDVCVFSNGLDTPVGNRGEFISGGERQRLTIARCLLKNPDLLLLDEPTTMLDVENKEKIKRILILLSKKRSIIIATHDKALMEIADIKIKIEDGKIL